MFMYTRTKVHILLKLIQLCDRRAGEFYRHSAVTCAYCGLNFVFISLNIKLFSGMSSFRFISHTFNCYTLKCSMCTSPINKLDHTVCLLSSKLRNSPNTLHGSVWSDYCSLYCWRCELGKKYIFKSENQVIFSIHSNRAGINNFTLAGTVLTSACCVVPQYRLIVLITLS